ncbi:ribosome maturation factor RimP [Alloiococcus sp. CFN-8]|uniref:ribosome maturation factor RimP n=1 Tax=Alloiococcus sp. CFN-8 TaxID=3416081 RepID=UPI003CF3E01F
MKIEELLKEVETIVSSIVENMHYELYHLEYVKENGEYYLRIYIDTPSGISLQDCEKVSRAVSVALDEKDPIKDQYYLEISSPGINRFLHTEKHFLDNINKKVKINTTKPIEGKKVMIGILDQYSSEEIIALIDNKPISIPLDKIKSVNIEEDFS